MPIFFSSKALPLSRHPWIYFFIFVVINALLSYGSISIEAKLWLGFFGLVLPFLGAGWGIISHPSKTMPSDQKEFLPPIPLWAWGLVGVLAVAARFTSLTTLFVWPNFDESSYGFDAFHLAAEGDPRLFYGVSQAPPLFVWGLALFFKVFGVSLTTFWFFPALVSLTTTPLAYAAARTFFSKSFSFLCAVLAAASFWPVFLGRFSLMTILILPMELLAFWSLGKFFQAKTANARVNAAWGIGVVWGTGLYTHLHWPVVMAITGLPLVYWAFKNFRKQPDFVGSLAARAVGIALLLDLPLLIGALHQHYGGYLMHLWAFHRDFSSEKQLAVWASYLTSPFWGMDPDVHTYQPQWGGFLNPVLTSLFFLGLLRVMEKRSLHIFLFLAGGYLLGLMPGLLTQDMETFRLFPLFPLLVVGASFGWATLLASRPARNLILVLALFLPSLSLDATHLFVFYHQIWDRPASWGFYTKSIGRYRAFRILEGFRNKEGPGLVFPDFVSGLPDQSLSVATYGYNAALNLRIPLSQARWAALLTNVNYRPFLQNRFPEGTAYALSKDFVEPDGGWMLFVFPLDEKRRRIMEDWCRAQRALETFIDQNLCYIMGQSFKKDLEALAKLGPSFQGDPFLQAAYLEKKADLETKQALMDLENGVVAGPALAPAIESLEKAVAEGYPSSHLYEHLGILWLMDKKPEKAKKNFEKALRCPLDLTDSAKYVSTLDRTRVKGKGL